MTLNPLPAFIEVVAALRDIITAAHNGEPYTAEELQREFLTILSEAEATLQEGGQQ